MRKQLVDHVRDKENVRTRPARRRKGEVGGLPDRIRAPPEARREESSSEGTRYGGCPPGRTGQSSEVTEVEGPYTWMRRQRLLEITCCAESYLRSEIADSWQTFSVYLRDPTNRLKFECKPVYHDMEIAARMSQEDSSLRQ